MPTVSPMYRYYNQREHHFVIKGEDRTGWFCMKCRRLKSDNDCAEDQCPVAKPV